MNGRNAKCGRKGWKVKVDHRLARSVSRGWSKSHFHWLSTSVTSQEKAKDPRVPQTQSDRCSQGKREETLVAKS